MNNCVIRCKDVGRYDVKVAQDAIYTDFSKTTIWLANLQDLTSEIPQFRQLLDSREVGKADRFHFPVDTNRYITGRAMLKMVLARYLSVKPEQVTISLGKKNKPYFRDSRRPVYFNLSHSGTFVVMALSFRNYLGIDVEEIKLNIDFDGVINKCFNQHEQAVIYSKEENIHHNFYTFWTRKESLLKAAGIGLIDDLKLLDMTGAATITPSVTKKYPGWFDQNFFVHSFMADENHAAAITLAQHDSTIDFFRFCPFPGA